MQTVYRLPESSSALFFIYQHSQWKVIDQVAGRNTDHRNGFVLPQMDNAAFDNFAGLNFEANGHAHFGFVFLGQGLF